VGLTIIEVATATYVIGVVIAVAAWRDPWLVRVGTAALWPLGVLSFAVVTVVLLLAALYLWPMLLLALIPIAAGVWLVF
jgi:hypothetical protein